MPSSTFLGEWFPIETAPRDGSRIDLIDAKRRQRAPDCYWHRKGERWVSKWHDKEGYSALRLPFAATHWARVMEPSHD